MVVGGLALRLHFLNQKYIPIYISSGEVATADFFSAKSEWFSTGYATQKDWVTAWHYLVEILMKHNKSKHHQGLAGVFSKYVI